MDSLDAGAVSVSCEAQQRRAWVGVLVGVAAMYALFRVAELLPWQATAGIGAMALLLTSWQLFKAVYIPRACDPAKVRDEVEAALAKRGRACPEYVGAYMKALKLDTAAEGYALGQQVGAAFGSDTLEAGARAAGQVNRLHLFRAGLRADYLLWKCARNTPAATREYLAYAAHVLGHVVVAMVLCGGAVAGAVHVAAPGDGAKLAGAFAAVVAAVGVPVLLRGRDRRAVGLPFLDVPRMVV